MKINVNAGLTFKTVRLLFEPSLCRQQRGSNALEPKLS